MFKKNKIAIYCFIISIHFLLKVWKYILPIDLLHVLIHDRQMAIKNISKNRNKFIKKSALQRCCLFSFMTNAA